MQTKYWFVIGFRKNMLLSHVLQKKILVRFLQLTLKFNFNYVRYSEKNEISVDFFSIVLISNASKALSIMELVKKLSNPTGVKTT